MTDGHDYGYAIVGMGGLFPDAPDLEAFWRNILEKRVSIRHFPADSVLSRVFYRPEVYGKQHKGDRTYTDLTAPIDSFAFEPEQFRIPPAVAKHMDANQKAALLVARQALAGGALDSVSKERVSVFMGNTMIGPLHHAFCRRFNFDRFAYHLAQSRALEDWIPPEKREAILAAIREEALAGTFPVTEDSAPGILPNIIASRICSAFDLRGHAFVIDAACASGLAAVACGIQQLRLGDADAVVCGAADMLDAEEGRIYFSGIGALSPDGSFPFDARANGFVIGQGAGVVVLKRLQDAIAAGDPVYAVVNGYGQSSDGKGKAIAAPNELGQALTIQRACEMAGHPADTIELIEAHGTSTQVGDRSEVNALRRAFSAMGGQGRASCGIGSVKSNIGHLKSAAGIAGLLKAVLAIHHKWLPPSAGFERLAPGIDLGDSPFYVLSEGKAWADKDHPRRAGVSAFGFGGANYHLALSEHRPHDLRPRPRSRPAAPGFTPSTDQSEPLWEVALFRGDDARQLLADAAELQARLADPALPAFPGFDVREALAEWNSRADRSWNQRLAFTVRSRADLEAKLELVRACGPSPEGLAQLQPRGLFFDAAPPRELSQVAALFPGQGSQYPDMLHELRDRFGAARNLQARADRLWRTLAGTSISALLDSAGQGKEAAEQRLRETAHTHPAMMAASLEAYAVLEQMGLRPAYLLGHSLGEFTALVAAGRLALADGLALMQARGAALAQVPPDRGGMLALPVAEAGARALTAELRRSVTIANVNGPQQTIVSGEREALAELAERATARGLRPVPVNVSCPFHSPLVAGAQDAFLPALQRVRVRPAQPRVLAASTAEYYSDEAAQVIQAMSTQITRPVNFVGSVERLYADGARVFVEVGPGSILSRLAREILAGRPALILASDSRQGDSSEAFLRLLCQLHVAGLPVDPSGAEVVEPHEPKSQSVMVTAASAAGEGRRVVYGGVAVGLPGSFKDAFRDDNFDQLFEGRNQIERLTDAERRRLLELRVSKVVKSEQGASIVELRSLEEVIQLAGKLGRLDLAAGYQVDEKELLTMSRSVAHAVAAGYEALRDAQIPLVREWVRTASGRTLPERWALPQEMQAGTGVIFANGFPLMEPVIAEVSRHLSRTLGSRARDAIRDFYEELIPRVSHAESRRLLTDWFALNYARLCASPDEAEVYRFNHQFMTQLSCQANNRLARCVNARGPNFQLNAACSSTPTAVLLSEELIRSGRVQRMIVVGADDPSSEASLPYVGAGFLSTGACSSEGDVYEAAVPFDRRRNGMIMGAGAVGIVVEAAEECARRGVAPVCELLGTHAFNAAAHPSQLDVPRYADELELFIRQMEARHGLSRATLAADLAYFSHEPYTPPRGGCSEAEATALRHVFGDRCGEIEVTNTKGMTGHTMGAALEDAAAAKALQHGRVPPVVNHREVDPALAGLKLSRGGRRDLGHALRMAAGFGSQGNYLLLRRAARGEDRIQDPATYRAWLSRVSGLPAPVLAHHGRTLVIEDAQPGAVLANRPSLDRARTGTPPSAPTPALIELPKAPSASLTPKLPSLAAPPTGERADASEASVRERVLDAVAAITGYQRSMLDLDMELEADLGIDTVKQATVLATLAEELGVGDLGEVRLFDYPTLRGLVGLFTGKHAGAAPVAEAPSEAPPASRDEPAPGRAETAPGIDEQVRAVVAQVTGYQPSMIEPNMELEADLGVDTVKQATILAMLGERFGVAPEAEFRISEFPTVNHLIAHFQRGAKGAAPVYPRDAPVPVSAPAAGPTAPAPAPAPPGQDLPPVPMAASGRASSDRIDVSHRLLALLAEHTPYPREMLELDLTLETDLGLDAETREKLRTACIQTFGLPSDWRLPADARLDALALEIAGAGRADGAGPEEPALELARQVRVLVPAPLYAGSESLAGKRVWIWGDDPGYVQACAAAVGSRAGEVHPWCFPASGSPDETLAALSPLLQGQSPDLLVDLTACGARRSLAEATADETAVIVARAADCRFVAWKRLAEAQRLPGRILAVTAIDGVHGLSDAGGPLDPVFGLHVGFYKALRREWPERHLTILDLAPRSLTAPAATDFEPLLGELAGRGPGVEICRAAGVRQRVALEDSPPPERSAQPASGPDEVGEVVLATGGGSGVTATILDHLVQGRPSRVALIGRTRLGPEVQRFHALAPEARLQEKEAIRARLSQAGQRVTPVMVEEAWAALQRGTEVLETLARLQSAGCSATYHAADVADRAQLAAALDEVRRVHGPITTLIHGAGREVSRKLERKSLEEFQSVHRVKTLGACHLGALCAKDPLRRVVAVSSIAGVLGSATQVDYSAANAFLDLWARACRRARGIQGTSLVWSGWAERGMAWRNGFLRENGERAGLNFIPPDEGGRAAAREIWSASGDVEVVLHRGLGELLDPELAASSLAASPMVDWVSRGSGPLPAIHRRFSAARDAILDQHRLAGTPLMPGVGFMELMAEAHRLITQEEAGPTVFRQLAFRDAFKLYRDESRDVTVRSAPAAINSGERRGLRMEVWSPFRPRAGGAAEQRLYCSAVVSREAMSPPVQSPSVWGLGELSGQERSDWARLLVADPTLEKNVLFGPIFNDARRSGHAIAELEVVYGKAGIRARAPLPRAQLSEPRYPLDRYLINPAFLDSLHQAGAVFCILETGQVYLPVGAEEFAIFQPPREEGQYEVIARVSDRSQDQFLFDIAMLRDDQELCCLAHNVAFRRIRQ